MDRYRLNQMLEILLFPITDSRLAVHDPMLECIQAYHDFMEKSDNPASTVQERNRKDQEYKRLRNKLLSYLAERSHGAVKSKDDIEMLCELFYPLDDINDIIKHIAELRLGSGQKKPDMDSVSVYYLWSMARISRSLITYRDGAAAIKQWVDKPKWKFGKDIFSSPTVFNKIEVWNLLCRMAAPDLFIAIAAVENGLELSALYEQNANIALADKLLIKVLSKGVAENHLHFNVGFAYDVLWISYMDLKFVEERQSINWKKSEFVRLEMAIFRYSAARYLENRRADVSFLKWAEANMPKEILEIVGMLYWGVYEGQPNRRVRSALHGLQLYCNDRMGIYRYDYLLNQVYGRYIEYGTSSEYILLYQSYRYIREDGQDVFFARLFVQYLRLKNEYFRKSLQAHVMQGLKYFREAYGMTKKLIGEMMSEEEIMVEAFRTQAKMPFLRKLEIRIAPQVDGMGLDVLHYRSCRRSILQQLYSQINQVLYAYRRYILENTIGITETWEFLKNEKGQVRQKELPAAVIKKAAAAQVSVPVLGIVYHFLKTEHLEDKSGSYCWRKVLDGNEIRSVYRGLRRLYMADVALALEEIRETIPKIGEYIVGLDAASDENAMDPWMFVPAYKAMRSHESTRPVMKIEDGEGRFERVQNVGFTYHVGEDFRHVASGLRHVDEVLTEFGYKAGDRLGHALVLGIDMELWMEHNEAVPLTKLEYLENLLWMWGINICAGLDLPIKIEVLEDKIINLAADIYESQEPLSVKMLYNAYKKKFEPNHEKIIRQTSAEINEEENGKCPCGKEVSQDCGRIRKRACYGALWTEDKLLMTNYCPVFEKIYGEIVLVPVQRNDAVIYKKLQNYLIDKVEKLGIYIEENPTSNLTIGDFSHMRQHPIFSLNDGRQKEGHHVFVTVNSDNPAIFNTNVENELAYIYYAADAQGIPKSEVLKWIDKIRQYGMDASFIRQEKSPEQILAELQRIMWEISKHMRVFDNVN